MRARTVVYLTILALVLAELVACMTRRTLPSALDTQISRGASTDTHSVIVQYGYTKNGSVGYIAFTASRKDQIKKDPGIVSMVSNADGMGSETAYITKPNGEGVDLPCDTQLFECIDGQYAETKEKVDREVFEAFLASEPTEYTIKALLAFREKEKSARR